MKENETIDRKVYERFTVLMESNLRMVWAMCRRYSHGDRDVCYDLSQEVWISVWRHFGNLREGSNALMERAWVWWMARTALANSARGRHVERLPDGFEVADSEALERLQQSELLDEAMATLGPREQRVVRMRLEGYAYDAIGHATGTSATAAKQVMHRALQKMKLTVKKAWI